MIQKPSLLKKAMNALSVPVEKKSWFKSLFLSTKTKHTICAIVAVTVVLSFSQNTINIRQTARELSIYLGDGQCKWTPPTYDVPEDINFTKTLIAGFPSGDKRLTFVQMEALTGLSARDEWDFAYLVSQPDSRWIGY